MFNSSTELGSLWTTYHKKTMILRILEYLIEKSDDQKAKDLMSGLFEKLHPMVIELKTMLENDGAAPPIGFTKEDVNLYATKLYENGFDIMFCRILKEISMGMYVLHMTTSYREGIVTFYKQLTDLSQTYYNQFTQYLIEKDFLPRPNYTTMPNSVDYITDKSYMKGTNFFVHAYFVIFGGKKFCILLWKGSPVGEFVPLFSTKTIFWQQPQKPPFIFTKTQSLWNEIHQPFLALSYDN